MKVYYNNDLYTFYQIGLVHTLGVSVEIELKIDWQGCKKVQKLSNLVVNQ